MRGRVVTEQPRLDGRADGRLRERIIDRENGKVGLEDDEGLVARRCGLVVGRRQLFEGDGGCSKATGADHKKGGGRRVW